MSNFNLFFIVCVVLADSVRCNVPVLLWESSSVSDKDDLIPALYQLDSDEFSNHLVKKLRQHKPLVVLFLEESLSVEDFSWKDDRGHGSFPQLQNLTAMSAKTEFVTSVYDPVAALKDLAESQDYTWVKYDGKSMPKSQAVLEVRLEDPSADEDRPELLRRHDSSIAETYSRLLSKYSHMVALLTGKYSSWVEPEYNRVRREAADNSSTSEISNFNLTANMKDNTFALIKSSMPATLIQEGGNETSLTSLQGQFTDRKKNQNSVIAKYQDDHRIKFTFTRTEAYWKLANVMLNEQNLTSPIDISKPIGTPFISTTPIEFSKGPTKLRFKDLQMQGYSDKPYFGNKLPVYFTYPILMGIFVTVILGIILSWAIIMMMDIRTMDRFDDPKGKTITVTQGE